MRHCTRGTISVDVDNDYVDVSVRWLLIVLYVWFVGIDVSASLLCVFFVQAEDGIRDLVRSRGLGDVYKRQLRDRPAFGAAQDFGQ